MIQGKVSRELRAMGCSTIPGVLLALYPVKIAPPGLGKHGGSLDHLSFLFSTHLPLLRI